MTKIRVKTETIQHKFKDYKENILSSYSAPYICKLCKKEINIYRSQRAKNNKLCQNCMEVLDETN